MSARICVNIRKVFIVMILALVPIVAIMNYVVTYSRSVQPRIKLVYFYENVCSSCNPEGEFIDLYNKLIGDEKDGVEVEILMYNVFHQSRLNIAKQYFKDYRVPEEKQHFPAVFIGNRYLIGNREIEDKLKEAFIASKEDWTIKFKEEQINDSSGNTQMSNASKFGQDTNQTPTQTRNSDQNADNFAVYFYVTACNECQEVSDFLDAIRSKLPDLKKYNIGEYEGLVLAKEYYQAYNVPESKQTVPVVFIGDTYLTGAEEIKNKLLEQVKKNSDSFTPVLAGHNKQIRTEVEELSGYKALGVLVTGLINGLNPCSISMLIFFLSILMAQNINILKIGFVFIAGKFIAYFLLGTLLFNLFIQLNIQWYQTVTKAVLLLFMLSISILNILDYIAAKNENYSKIRMQLPEFLRKWNHHCIKRLSVVRKHRLLLFLCFSLGVLIALGEFLCTGQIYLSTIILVLQSSPLFNMQATIYFLLYNLAFITPLSIITIFVYRGREIFELSEFYREKMHAIKLINAIVFVIFGIILLVRL